MDNNGLSFFAILFLAFLALSAALIVWMFLSLMRLGDERRQLIVGKACTFSFMGMAGYLLLRTLVFLLGEGRELLHPLITLMVAAYLFAGSLAGTGTSWGVSPWTTRSAPCGKPGLSQEELAKACGVSPPDPSTPIENNKYDPTWPWPSTWPKPWHHSGRTVHPPGIISAPSKKSRHETVPALSHGICRFKVCPGTPWPRPD